MPLFTSPAVHRDHASSTEHYKTPKDLISLFIVFLALSKVNQEETMKPNNAQMFSMFILFKMYDHLLNYLCPQRLMCIISVSLRVHGAEILR